MIGDVVKACTFYQAGNGPTSVKLGSQVVGLVSVLAISGSVALLTFGKQKLWHYLFDSQQATFSDSRFRAPHCCSLSGGILAPRAEIELLPRQSCAEEEDGEANGSNQLLLPSSGLTNASQRKVKRVRFAPDVVEPAGDGQEYRRRFQAARRKQRLSTENQQESKLKMSNAESSREFQAQQKTARRDLLPANRIALYNGLMQNRLQQALYSR